MKNSSGKIIFILLMVIISLSCSSRSARDKSTWPASRMKQLDLMGYTIQVGAFAKVENAARLTEEINKHKLQATYFKAADQLFKVRFGNFPSLEEAKAKAQDLKNAGVIAEYYIVKPDEYSVSRKKQYGSDYLREALVKSARDFIGVAYLWGGASADTGFDCSGLTMTVYQLNGLDLPRHSARQFDEGQTVSRDNLQKGDLVFFAISGGKKVSHVGIYIGDGQFIHSPSRGKKIRVDFLASSYFAKRYVGGKTYLE